MENNQHSPNSISHKELNILLKKAIKESTEIKDSGIHDNINNQEFNDLILNWSETSRKILLILQKKETLIATNRNSKSLMAFGAMGAHINMALQALKAAELDQ